LLRPLVDDLAELHQKENELATHALAQSSVRFSFNRLTPCLAMPWRNRLTLMDMLIPAIC
jgi:hypothetical protein